MVFETEGLPASFLKALECRSIAMLVFGKNPINCANQYS